MNENTTASNVYFPFCWWYYEYLVRARPHGWSGMQQFLQQIVQVWPPQDFVLAIHLVGYVQQQLGLAINQEFAFGESFGFCRWDAELRNIHSGGGSCGGHARRAKGARPKADNNGKLLFSAQLLKALACTDDKRRANAENINSHAYSNACSDD